MAWSSGNFFVAPGATISIVFWWENNADHGPQWAMAQPFPNEPETWLMTERVGKKIVCEIGQIIQNGDAQYRCVESGGYQYLAHITNIGSQGCRFTLQGGGV
jgi:hypothetical protein